uniref:ANK_REP_REGION domain-containing protein n=1 Tax=Macrostomum lignano TaxID=282301 RepID=A0A1I8IM83_9PLAT
MMKTNENQSLIEAVKRGNLKDTCQILRNQRCGIDCADESGKTALQWATKYGHVTIVWHLIKAGAQVDRQDLKGWTPLHEAASFGRSQCACLLMELGAAANPNLRTAGEGNSPVHLAAEKGHSEVLRWLLSGGRANVNQQLTDGRSAAHKAARQGRWKSLELLLQAGADSNLRCHDGQTPLHLAALCNDNGRCVETLLCTGAADPNVLDNDGGFSPLHLAAACGRKSAVDYLLRACCHQPAAGGRQTRDKGALSPAQLAAGFGQDAVLLQLIQDWNLKRSSAQDFLNLPKCFEEILNRIQDLLKADKSVIIDAERRAAEPGAALGHATGRIRETTGPRRSPLCPTRCKRSSEGAGRDRDARTLMGNSLSGLDGVTDPDADIDLTVILDTQPQIHLEGCSCSKDAHEQTAQYENGHVQCSGFDSNPAGEFAASSIRPAVDIVRARKCCSYPAIRVLQEGYTSQIRESVLSCLRRELTDSQCHLVTAATTWRDRPAPGEHELPGANSTEKPDNGNRAQVFVLLKYLLKRVLSERAPGLKTYHAKTLIFYLLEETPEDEWQPNCLLSITGKGTGEASGDFECMMHFFLKDAWLYLKKGHCGKDKIANALQDLIDQLPQLLLQFKANLRPTSDDEPFHFHPFLTEASAATGRLQYHSLPDLVAEVLQKLTQEACSESLKASLESINRIPDFAKTTQQCLLVLVYLKFNLMHLAQQLLRDVMKCKPNGGPILKDLEPATAQSVLTHLESSDSAWKFCLWFNSCPPNLDFLPDLLERTRRHFPSKMQLVQMRFFNFSALIRCLSLELGLADGETARLWFEETLHCRNPDVQQLVVSMEFCPDRCLLAKLIVRHRDAICNLRVTRDKAMQLMRDDTELLTPLC